MIGRVVIRDLGVIESATLEPAAGLTAVTGETGAGKTMVVSGLGLLLGQRADPSLVRRGADRAVVEACLDVDPGLADMIGELGGEVEEGEVICSRQVLASRRSRSMVGGAQVTAGQLGRIMSSRVTVHGQSEQLRLASPERQLEVLDRAAGEQMSTLLESHEQLWSRYRRDRDELESRRSGVAERQLETEVLMRRLAEVDAVDPRAGEDDELAAEARRLQGAADIRATLARADQLVNGVETESGPASGAIGLLDEARRQLETLADDEHSAALAETTRAIGYDLAELAADLSGYAEQAAADPARLEEVNSRLAQIQRLLRSRATTLDRLLDDAADDRRRLAELEGSGEGIDALSRRVDDLAEELASSAARISEVRHATADRLGAAVLPELSALAMPRARLEFRLSEASMGPSGADQVAVMLAANPGSDPAPLARAASGGELSRVRLALEVVLASTETPQTLVFDEIDAGVGGAVGIEIGRRLARLARRHQVIVVTHLAQVAAFADRQLVVSKASDGRITRSGVREAAGGDRLVEIARMMSGLADSEVGIEHAQELLDLGAAR
ncbi:DNA repair protein RecN [Acidipropionibacterium virtanenii]|uniref:DNA repair protein RecN n=1 Tax=Acidipropionibacterium virtanenii TaxID=2057246 RepID=A0A344UTG7_9ACTN|nr:DNA repair protein RecN [Acidipropionibacterium virtanenii]AXE38565.1 DNA repair protein RecN [Acidipropionibacterium virtanenii]